MSAKNIISGVGARYAVIANLGTDGLPDVNVSSATGINGSLIQGLKTVTVNDPDPQRFTHYGDDNPFAQDSLPPTEVGNVTITVAKQNKVIDAMIEGNKIVTKGQMQMRAANTDKMGNEPQVFFAAYQQALDTDKTSDTFGKLRQWNLYIWPSIRLSGKTKSMEQGISDKTYAGTPTKVTETPWNEAFSESVWGNTQGEYIDISCDYHPRFNWGLGDGTITSFELTHPPVSSSYLDVWVDGTPATPSSVNTNSTNPAFTLTTPPGTTQKWFAIIQTDEPGTT
jgi:hypothetical protein